MNSELIIWNLPVSNFQLCVVTHVISCFCHSKKPPDKPAVQIVFQNYADYIFAAEADHRVLVSLCATAFGSRHTFSGHHTSLHALPAVTLSFPRAGIPVHGGSHTDSLHP